VTQNAQSPMVVHRALGCPVWPRPRIAAFCMTPRLPPTAAGQQGIAEQYHGDNGKRAPQEPYHVGECSILMWVNHHSSGYLMAVTSARSVAHIVSCNESTWFAEKCKTFMSKMVTKIYVSTGFSQLCDKWA